MVKEFLERWEENKWKIRESLKTKLPNYYEELVKLVISNITAEMYEDFAPDPERIHTIDDGNYQGTLLFIIGEKGSSPIIYYSLFVDYGSCGACDTLQGILDNKDWEELPTESQVNDCMILALHIVQGIKLIERGGEDD